MQSIIIRKTMRRPTAFHYPVSSVNPTMVNLYFRHSKPTNDGKKATSIRKAAFAISVQVPRFTTQSMNYTRPGNYY